MSNLLKQLSGEQIVDFLKWLDHSGITPEDIIEATKDWPRGFSDAAIACISKTERERIAMARKAPVWTWIGGEGSGKIRINLETEIRMGGRYTCLGEHMGTVYCKDEEFYCSGEVHWDWVPSQGSAEAELREGKLFIDGREFVSFIHDRQRAPKGASGKELHEEFSSTQENHLHPNVLDACAESGLLPPPKEFKPQDKQTELFGQAKLVAWGIGFMSYPDESGECQAFVKTVIWNQGKWHTEFNRKDGDEEWSGYQEVELDSSFDQFTAIAMVK